MRNLGSLQGESYRDSDVKYKDPLTEVLPMYTNTEDLLKRMREYKGEGKCPGANFEMEPHRRVVTVQDDVTHENLEHSLGLEVIRVSSTREQAPEGARKRALFVFGEHAREFISMESALHFVQKLCSDDGEAQAALRDFAITIVPVANPEERKFAEEGHFCKRRNENNVDLNRNFGSHRLSKEEQMPPSNETYGGPLTAGFSEPASVLLQELALTEKPTSFVSVHSGGYLVAMPYGYTEGPRPKEEDLNNMQEVLTKVRKLACNDNCLMGTLAEAIQYENPGCDMDYMYEEAKIPYSFTWEIFSGNNNGQSASSASSLVDKDEVTPYTQDRSQPKLLLSKTNRKAHGRQAVLQHQHQQQKLKRMEIDESMLSASESEAIECLSLFNPQDPVTFDNTLRSWTSAYLELFKLIKEQEQRKQAAI